MSNKTQKVDMDAHWSQVGVEMSYRLLYRAVCWSFYYFVHNNNWLGTENFLEAYADDATKLALITTRL